MKGLVVFYSATGSNRYLAQKIAEKSGFEMEEIHPRVNALFPQLLASLTKIGVGNRAIRRNFTEYDRIILCGPIWMGQVIYPLRSFIQKYKSQINKLYFLSCCGGGDEQKDSKFGYETVFFKMRSLLGDKFVSGFALPTQLLVKPGQREDELMKTRLSAENFSVVELRFNDALEEILKLRDI
ncbi:flavodoxin domain-containing protein [Oceanispirochaeta sp.]|jgi:flavodoxin|uniref:flavodoxin family protein n=1 Tax=Oceanispirochaeta sp. TaxID=2035350 RepID=UPI002624998D|nr:flavodoxin domain-containing protein [Oceanispirochaeta sp.]MDA3955714.1 hypothetical protein [Oceanispirochaeta sp.]